MLRERIQSDEKTYGDLPERLVEPLERWIQEAHRPGHFLEAVLENDLKKAMRYGDSESIDHLHTIVLLLDNAAPIGCWGSEERCKEWEEYGGLGEL